MVLDYAGDDKRVAQHWLYRCDDHTPFAFARGDDFIRYSDHTRWAWQHEDRLYSARSGACLAVRVDDVFYDVESDAPLYYEPPRPQLFSLGTNRPAGNAR